MLNRKLALSLVMLLCLVDGEVIAGETIRAGEWEGTVQVVGNLSTTVNGSGGSKLDVKGGAGFAFGVGFNINEKLGFGFDGSWFGPDYTAVGVREDGTRVMVDHKLSVFNAQFKGTWNLLDSDFTPYLEAGVGFNFIDSNVASDPPTPGCWWDPWWGYVCGDNYSTYQDKSISSGIGGGVRYELPNWIFFKGSMHYMVSDTVDNGSAPKWGVWRLEIGRIF